jgi:hypothetical protein
LTVFTLLPGKAAAERELRRKRKRRYAQGERIVFAVVGSVNVGLSRALSSVAGSQ